MIRSILACDSQGGIAKNGIMPWPKNKKDLQHFKKRTENSVVVMGRSTWEAADMPSPLPNRKNIVVTSNSEYMAPGATVVSHDVENYLKKLDCDQTVYVIGGAQLFISLYDLIEVINLTRIQGNFDCDTFLPLERIQQDFELIDHVAFDFQTEFETYIRKQNPNI